MNQSAITVRYAKAFFGLAKEKNILGTLKTDIELVNLVCANSADFIFLLESPVVKTSKKISVIKSVFADKINKFSVQFLLLIIKNRRETFIPGICRNFLALTKKDQNIRSAKLTTATEISSASIEKITKLLSQELHATIELSNHVNPDILGGIILRVEDNQFDASVASQLKRIKQTLLESELKYLH